MSDFLPHCMRVHIFNSLICTHFPNHRIFFREIITSKASKPLKFAEIWCT
jgi:hypothetical protein